MQQPECQQAPKPEHQQPLQQQLASAASAIPAEVLAAIQAAVSATVLPPLQQEVEQMKAAHHGGATESEEEEDDECKAMLIDARHKRSLDAENSNVLRLRKSGQAEGRPARVQRTTA